MGRKKLTIAQKCERFPPVACRLLARKQMPKGGVEPLSDEEIAAASGFTVPEVAKLSKKTSWMDVSVDTMLRFTRACGIDFDDRDSLRLHTAFLNTSRMKYLRKRPDWTLRWLPLFNLWREAEA